LFLCLTDVRISGFYGDFKCQDPKGLGNCNVVYIGSDNGDFVFDYSTDKQVLDALNLNNTVNRNNTISKIETAYENIPWGSSQRANLVSKNPNRRLQVVDATKKLYNPVICIKEGDTVFFQVNSQTRNFPQYSKDSILNTNKDFDYGPFSDL
jgi:hypothetical protein